MQKSKSGAIPKLDADESLMVLAIDTDIQVHPEFCEAGHRKLGT